MLAGLPKLNLYQLTPEELETWIVDERGHPRAWVEKLRKWLYKKGVPSFQEMKDIPKRFRNELDEIACVGASDWTVLAERLSKDGTIKRAYGIPGGHAIESVLMSYDDGRRTACISSQVGCAMGCVFCATGQMGFKRHLTAAEIFEQAARYSALLQRDGQRLSSVVLLGMGEPLANYDNVVAAMRRVHDELGVGWRRITISTVGLAPQIHRLAEEGLPVTLAISLHAATDEERSALLPTNKRYPIAAVMEAARYYRATTGRRVSFEWTLIEGTNDDEATADRLGRLLAENAPSGSHLNLIPLNPTKGFEGGRATQYKASRRFVDVVARYGVEATVRVRRGIDIDAGCGQLAERATEEYTALAVELPGAPGDVLTAVAEPLSLP